MQQIPLIFVLYDSINNSIFEGQILQPLLERKKRESNRTIYLLSYEIHKPHDEKVRRIAALDIQLIILPKDKWWLSIRRLKKILHRFSGYELIARGPLAGYRCLKAVDHTKCTQLTIQARGLLAQEYDYAHHNEENTLMRLLYTIRGNYFAHLEHKVYHQATRRPNCTVEAVSPALKQYITHNFRADPSNIIIATYDIPASIPSEQIYSWRQIIRTQFHIAPTACVYCYNGSIKPWQCPELTIEFFKQKLYENKNSILLVLTQDLIPFQILLQQNNIPPAQYRLLHVTHREIYQYLAAADVGLLFRQPHIINWVSRPTKLLEYHAVGLEIAHNDTVAYVSEIKSMRSTLS